MSAKFNTLHTDRDFCRDLNPMRRVRGTTKVVFEHCVIYAHGATVTAVLSSQGQFQVTAGCLWRQ
jgi:hypothetical protein